MSDIKEPKEKSVQDESKLTMTKAEGQKEYELRKKLKSQICNGNGCALGTSNEISAVKQKVLKNPLAAESQKRYRLRKKFAQFCENNKECKTVVSESQDVPEPKRIKMDTKLFKEEKMIYILADAEFENLFVKNPFGHVCDICHKLWFKNDLKSVDPRHFSLLQQEFPGENICDFHVCGYCIKTLKINKIPYASRSNGFFYPEYPKDLPELDCITERLVSPILPFIQLRRLRYDADTHGIMSQVINVPAESNNLVTVLPRQLENDYTLNVHFKKHLINKSSSLKSFVKVDTVKKWLSYLVNTPLYKKFNFTIDDSIFNTLESGDKNDENIEPISVHKVEENELLIFQQQTLLWDECEYFYDTTDQEQSLLSWINYELMEELSFPGIYLGYPRQLRSKVNVTPFLVASSEIRRRDRRGVTPQHILYMALKILRQKVKRGLCTKFNSMTDEFKKMTENQEVLEQSIEHSLSFLKHIPNSDHYWTLQKKDVFAMMRQLGKPTMFLKLDASETKWPELLKILYKLKHDGKELVGDPFLVLRRLERCALVNEDSVTCAIYFNKLVNVIIHILMSSVYTPFAKYRVTDYFKRIDFQHSGSPQAHIFLWLANDPKESLSEDMPKTLNLINKLCRLNKADVESTYSFQIHKHTSNCYETNSKICRFGAPFWPMNETRILIPMCSEDKRRKVFKDKFIFLKDNLELKHYDSLEDFLFENHIKSMDEYLNIIRSGLDRPSLVMKRNMDEIWTNNFNPWILKTLNSSMDLQFMLDEQTCAAYVVGYVSKFNRGINNLCQELIQIKNKCSDENETSILTELSTKMLNSVELSSQEAAWYLLRQPISESSRKIEYIPTIWPNERHKYEKNKEFDTEEKSSDTSKDNLIRKYEKRPHDRLTNVSLAQFVSKYIASKNVYKLRKMPKIIRYRQYDISDTINYKREMVTLFYPFFSEQEDILKGNKFLEIYDNNEKVILDNKKEFESNIDIEKTIALSHQLCINTDESAEAGASANNI